MRVDSIPGRTFTGVVEKISPKEDLKFDHIVHNVPRTWETRISLLGDGQHQLRSGM